MKKYLINYADNSHYQAQKNNSNTGINIAGFDEVIEYSIQDLDEDFKNENYHILSQGRGAGYWIWKPYIILKTLEKIDDGDIVFYSDSGAEFISSCKPLIDICIKETQGLVCFAIDPHVTGNPDIGQIKRDALILMDCDTEEYTNTNARLASFIIVQKNKLIKKFMQDWLKYCQDERILTDIPNQLGQDHSKFITHRHDQAIFSVLTKKYNFEAYLDPSQWGIPFRGLIKGNYPQIVNHTRSPI